MVVTLKIIGNSFYNLSITRPNIKLIQCMEMGSFNAFT